MSSTLDKPEAADRSLQPRRRTLALRSRGRDATLAALEFGDADRPLDVVFLNANGFNAMTYRSVLAPLASTLHILAVDQRGHGRSPQDTVGEGRRDWLDLRDDLLGLLEALDAPPLVLSGHSMGGTVCLLAAAERPDRVKALALFDPVFISAEARIAAGVDGVVDNRLKVGAERRRSVFASRDEVFASYRGRGAFATWPDEALRDYIVDGFRDRPDGTVELSCAPAWEASGFGAHGHDPWAAMRKVMVPVTILRAEMATTCNLETPAQFNPGNPHVRVDTIPGTSHFLPIERPDLARQVLLEMART
jgi:pimeloyl-ACP methyl ester carboxylesterase